MFPIRVKTVQESDLRMLGSLARNIQRVLPVTQADIDAAAALGKGWVVWKVFEVSEPLDNLRGGTQLVIRQNSIQPGQNVRRVIFVAGPGGQTVVIRGTDYIVLPDAIANSLSYVKAFGGTEQNGTPTPDTPFDIVSNNGVLKARHQSGLPLGYKKLEYLKATGTQLINTGIRGGDDDLVIDVVCKYSVWVQYGAILGNWIQDGYNAIRIITAGTDNDNLLFNYNNLSGAGTTLAFAPKNTRLHIVLQKGSVTVNGVTTTILPQTGTANNTVIALFNRNIDNPANRNIGLEVESYSVSKNNVVIQNLVPCQRYDNVLGMYDTVSDTFLTNAGTGDFVAGNPVSDPVEIYTDGTVETINVHGKNLWNGGDITTERIVSGVWERYGVQNNVGNGTWSCQHCTNIPAGTWTISFVGTASRVVTYDGTSTVVYTITAGARKRATVTLPTDGEIWLFCANASAAAAVADVMVELGSTATEYEPYFDGGTATAEMLLKVGDYQDEQEILSGAITRKVGVKVFDGSETFTVSSSGAMITQIPDVAVGATNNPINTHFALETSPTSLNVGKQRFGASSTQIYSANYYMKPLTTMTAAQFKQWLAQQYAAGTPVIVIYPLKTPTTESVAGQTLQVTDGDNTLEITQASLNGLELEAQYNAAVSLTIQEVQDANLDNNVTVTIQ